MLTFAAAVGAMAMKVTAAPILRRFGFRRVLIANAVLSAGFLAAMASSAGTRRLAHHRPAAGGRLLPLAAVHRINTIAYADIERKASSRGRP